MADNNPNVILRKKAYEPGTDSTSGVITFDTNEKKIYLDSDVYGEQNVQADWNEIGTASPSYILNKPTIPTVNDATLTITQNGVTVGTFTANSSVSKTVGLQTVETMSSLTDVTISSIADGQILQYDSESGKWVNEDTEFVCTFTSTTSGDTTTYSCDKTIAEIYAAHQAGKNVVGVDDDNNGAILTLRGCEITSAVFNGDIHIYLPNFLGLNSVAAITFTGVVDNQEDSWFYAINEYDPSKLSSIPKRINDLTDVTISSISDGEILKYNETSGKWVNGEVAQSDWEQSIGTAPDYIKNRTHWKEETDKSSFVSATVMMNSAGDGCTYMSGSDPLPQLKEGSAYTFDVYFPYDDGAEDYLAHKRYVGVKSADASETIYVNGVIWYDASGFGYRRGDMNGDGETESFGFSIIDNEFASYFQQGGEALIEVSEFFLDTDLYTLSQLSQQQGAGVYSFNAGENDIEIMLTDSYGIGLFSEGNGYKLKVGENEYIGTASSAMSYVGAPSWFIGNPSIFGGQDNGEVFSVASEDFTGYPATYTKALRIKIPSSGADYTSSTGSTAISLYLGRHYLYHKLDNGYLDLSDVAFSGSYSDLSGKPDSVTDFPDVVISTLMDGDVLKYNSGTGKWENGIGSGGTSIQVRVWSSDGN